MIELSKFPFKTEKVAPKISDNKSTSLLLQAGLIRQTMAGVYNYTTLGLRVLKKIENIVREELNNYNCYEILMSGISPQDVWEKTNRWEIEEYFKLPTYGGKFYRLNPTHEEIVVPLLKQFVKSYKDLPTCVYQIQTKYRNEKRAKSGLLRGREFIMKDAYSFHITEDDFQNFYNGMIKTYKKIFDRLGIGKDTYVTLADGGSFTDKFSHEFQTILDVGEDLIYIDEKEGISYNQEIAPSMVGTENISEKELKKREDVKLPKNIVGVDNISKYLGIPKEKTTKTLFFIADEKRFVVASVRGDYDINEMKLKKVVNAKMLRLANESEIKDKIGTDIGFAGIINLPDNVELYLDDSLKGLTNFETGTNKNGYHSLNINFGIDLKNPEKFYDFKNAKIGDKNPKTGNKYIVKKASEVGNIFPLENKYSKPFDLKILNKDGKEVDVIMGCYGIGVSRLMGVVAEYFMKDNGIAWPENLAPADYYIIVLQNNLEKAKNIAKNLEKSGKEVILDDRKGKKFGFGVKIKDAELLGIPNIIIVSDNTLQKGGYELRKLGEDEGKIVKL